MNYHKQCILQKGSEIQTAWIPEKFAKLGKHVELLQDEEWINSWKVIEVGARISSEALAERSRDYKHTREASDV